ncbi:PD-(D/E)XK nuclease family protein [Hymenobacter gummosus]|nr:PD-(D/E)XK nuclease family protein [Hymenobacter gummosus]
MDEELMQLHKLLSGFKNLNIKERKGPTLLEIARCPGRETVWSNILAFYLNPNLEHGLYDLLLKSLFEALGKEVPSPNLRSVSVETEYLTAVGNRIDLVITADTFVLGIENKVDAGLYNDLADYSRALTGCAAGKVPVHKVVLSKHPALVSNSFENLLYTDIMRAVRRNLGGYTDYVDSKYLVFFLDFLKTIENSYKNSYMTDNMDVVNFLRNNAEEVGRLMSYYNGLQKEMVLKLENIDRLLVERLFDNSTLGQRLAALGGRLQGQAANKRSGRFTWQGDALVKHNLQLNGVSVFYQLGVNWKHKLYAHYWVDGRQNQHYEQIFSEHHIIAKEFDLEDQDETIAQTVEQQLAQMVELLAFREHPYLGTTTVES